MATVADCFDTCHFTSDPDGLLHLRLAPTGGITCEEDGLHADSGAAYENHIALQLGPGAGMADPLSTTGLVTPGDGPVSAISDIMVPQANPWPSNALLTFDIRADLTIVAGTGAGRGKFTCNISPDGVIPYYQAQWTAFHSTGGQEAYSSWAGPAYFLVPPSWTGTPKAVLTYETLAGAGANLVRCERIDVTLLFHRA